MPPQPPRQTSTETLPTWSSVSWRRQAGQVMMRGAWSVFSIQCSVASSPCSVFCMPTSLSSLAVVRRLMTVGEKLLEAGEIVGVDEVNALGLHFAPENGLVRCAPEADAAAVLVGFGDDLGELLLFVRRQLARAPPLESCAPTGADPGDEAGGFLRVQLGQLSVIGCVADGFTIEHLKRTVAGEDDDNGVGFLDVGAKGRQHIRVLFKNVEQNRVSRAPVRLDVNEKGELGAVGIDVPAVFPDPFAEGIQVERLEGAVWFGHLALMGDQEFTFDDVNVGLDAAEAALKGIEQRAFVQVVVVGMGVNEWDLFPSWSPDDASGFRVRVLAVLEDLNPVDEYVPHAGGILVWFFKGRMVLDLGGIEDHDVREITRLEGAAAVEL